MKRIILSFVFAIFLSCLFAQNYMAVDNGSAIKFSIKNFGLNVSGSFTGLKGKLSFNPANPAASSINASVDAATVNTGNGSRDGHLKKEEYFNVAKYPLISFVSTKITGSSKPGSFLVEGNITIKGVTKKVSFPFTATAKGEGYLFAGEFKLNRRDFEVGGKSMVMSDNLTVSLSVFAKKN
ncbi:MAG: YceI family protein [Ferruginibacter sp.]|nr:YceI family protein [Ferruginibacter sp.]